MDIRNLEYFIEVARQRSFSKAAQTMHISQPTISKIIKDMETQFDATLFYRNTKYVELTDEGEIVLAQAQQIVSSFRNIPAQLEGLTKRQTGKIHIGLPPITAVTSFSQLLSVFRNEYPKIDIHLYEFGPKKIEASVQDGLLDIGIFTPSNFNDLYEKIWFEQDPLHVIMHPTHSLAQHDVLGWESLMDEQFVLYTSDYKLRDEIIDRCQQTGFTPKITLETSQRELMTQMVAANLGIALLPGKICKSLAPGTLSFRPLADPQLYLRLALVWRKDRYLSHAVREFLNFARTKCADH